jgi:NAD(P)-dependent dehydrogenase (short-subunit alcohol dehydrogenase family)
MTPADFRQTIDVNLMGTVYTCRAAWRHMKAKGYGRIINTSSGSMTGLAWQTAYAAAKGAVYSFTRALAAEGADHGIKANSIFPGALTRMVYAAQAEDSSFIRHAREHMPPEAVSPTVGLLAHETCPITGECIDSKGGHLSLFYLARTAGFQDPLNTIESLAERWQELMVGTAPGLSRYDEADPREWSPKPYVPIS